MGRRSAIDSEIYGMKISQLLLPVTGHRIPYFEALKNKYNKKAPLVNENQSSSLGVIGSTGFLILIFVLLFRGLQHKIELIESLSILNISAVLLGTIGGFGSIFAHIVSPQIRAYNRISVFIAFFSLFAVILMLQHLYKRYERTMASKLIFKALLWIVLFIGILDQTSAFSARYSLTKAQYAHDASFVRNIESLMPTNAMIFQLPYVPFPEALPEHNLENYDLSKGYLHSKTLRWSFGTMKGREGDVWQQSVVEKPPEDFLEAIYSAGFSGLYIDRNGYEDSGAELESKLLRLLNNRPITSSNNRMIFFDIREYFEK
jgi:phosphoglycerol transferase